MVFMLLNLCMRHPGGAPLVGMRGGMEHGEHLLPAPLPPALDDKHFDVQDLSCTLPQLSGYEYDIGIAKATKDEATKMCLAAELLRPQRMRQPKDRL